MKTNIKFLKNCIRQCGLHMCNLWDEQEKQSASLFSGYVNKHFRNHHGKQSKQREKNIVISFSDIDKSVYTALKQKLDGQTDNPFGIYCKSKNLKCKIEYIIKPDVQEFNSKLKSIQAGNVLIVEIGTVPQPLFNYVFANLLFHLYSRDKELQISRFLPNIHFCKWQGQQLEKESHQSIHPLACVPPLRHIRINISMQLLCNK